MSTYSESCIDETITVNPAKWFVHLVTQSQGLPLEALHGQNLDRKLTGATVGYNVAVANSSLRYNLRVP